MIFRFSFKCLFVTTAAFAILAAGVPAFGAGEKPEVEVDLSVLQDLPTRTQPQPAPLNNPAPVEATPLQPGYVSHAAPAQLPISELTPPEKPAQPPVSKPNPPAKPAPKTKAKAVHKAAVVKKKKPPARRPHHTVPPPARKPQVATIKAPVKAPVAPAVTPAPAKTLLSIDAPTQNPAPDNGKPAANIEDISAAPNPLQPAPSSPAPPQPVAIKTVPATAPPVTPVPPAATAPEKSAPEVPKQTAAAPVASQPPVDNQNIPQPPPVDSRETSRISLPFKAGVADQLDDQITSTLQSQILPVLKDHPAWRLQVNAFASPVDNEPISSRRVSLARALAVRSWLLDKGVAARRIDVRAAGLETGHEPPDRVDIVFLDPDAG